MEKNGDQGNQKGEKQFWKNDDHSKNKKNWLEWSVFAIGLMLVLAILGYLGYQTYTQVPSPPDLYVQSWLEPSENAPNSYHVVLENRGGTTAEEVILELSLMQGNKALETAQLQISFAPQDSKREGWVGFRISPEKSDTVITRVVSYKKP